MLNHHYFKPICIALLIPFFIPLLSQLLIYINTLNTMTDNVVNFGVNYMAQFFELNPPGILIQVLSLMFWPTLVTIVTALFYRHVLKKTFKHYMICAILLWLFFNCGRFIS